MTDRQQKTPIIFSTVVLLLLNK